jgi:hypothetical protein
MLDRLHSKPYHIRVYVGDLISDALRISPGTFILLS